MLANPSKQELSDRISGLFALLRESGPSFDTAIIADRVNQYYFTGTMQDGLLVLRRDGTVAYFIRKSFERARLESPLDILYRMTTYRDMLAILPADLGCTLLETDIVPLVMLDRLRKYFTIGEIQPLTPLIQTLRSVKSEYELAIIAESGRQHQILLQEIVPQILVEDMSEADFMAELYNRMVRLGHHGVSRFSMFQMEMIAGQVGFGDSSIYPTNFDGPGGMLGMSPAVPIIGSRKIYLQKGDLVFVDIGYGVHGYHSDKTQVYSFGTRPSDEVRSIHQACLDVMRQASVLLTVGRIPADLYKQVMADLPPVLQQNFMGYGDERVRFLGHGVGLHIDEMPVITASAMSPLRENMVIALEPKRGIAGTGTVGAEETYVVKAGGPVCLTGGAREIIVV